MSKDNEQNEKHLHSSGCGCSPAFFVDMIEQAGRQLSRREFIKSATAAGGMLAAGGMVTSALSGKKALAGDSPADAIYHGGPILTMTADGDRAEALAVKDGRILAVGALAELAGRKGSATRMVDLAALMGSSL